MFFKMCIELNIFLIFNVFMFCSLWSPKDIHTGGFPVWIETLKGTHPKCQASSYATRDISRGEIFPPFPTLQHGPLGHFCVKSHHRWRLEKRRGQVAVGHRGCQRGEENTGAGKKRQRREEGKQKRGHVEPAACKLPGFYYSPQD